MGMRREVYLWKTFVLIQTYWENKFASKQEISIMENKNQLHDIKINCNEKIDGNKLYI